MVAVRWLVFVVALVLTFAALDIAAQTRNTFANPAEYDAYVKALKAELEGKAG